MPASNKDLHPAVLSTVIWIVIFISMNCCFGLPSANHHAPGGAAAGVPAWGHGRLRAGKTTDVLTSSHRSREELRIEAIKTSILASLNMREPPSPEVIAKARANLTPEEVARAFQLYDETVREEQSRSAAFATQQPPRKNVQQFHSVGSLREDIHPDPHSKPVTLFFSSKDVTASRQAGDVVDAHLKLYFRHDSPIPIHRHAHRKERLTCSVYMLLVENTTLPQEPRARRFLDSKTLRISSPGWKSFHITLAVQSWLSSPTTELALSVVVNGHSAEDIFYLEQSLPHASSRASVRKPRVEVLYKAPDPGFTRTRRQANQQNYDCQRGDGVTTCCRYERNVSYVDLQWDNWILRPSSYVSNECSGHCPKNFRSGSPYSRIKSLMHDIDPEDWEAPCCAPTKFSPSYYVFINSTGDIEVTRQEDTVVDECRCL